MTRRTRRAILRPAAALEEEVRWRQVLHGNRRADHCRGKRWRSHRSPSATRSSPTTRPARVSFRTAPSTGGSSGSINRRLLPLHRRCAAIVKAVGNVKNIAILNYSDNAAYIECARHLAEDRRRAQPVRGQRGVPDGDAGLLSDHFQAARQEPRSDLHRRVAGDSRTADPAAPRGPASRRRSPEMRRSSIRRHSPFRRERQQGAIPIARGFPTFNSRKKPRIHRRVQEASSGATRVHSPRTHMTSRTSLMDAIKRTGGSSDRVKLRNALATTKNFSRRQRQGQLWPAGRRPQFASPCRSSASRLPVRSRSSATFRSRRDAHSRYGN